MGVAERIQLSNIQKHVLVEEVLVQANLALMAYDELRSLVENSDTKQRRECWAYIQSLLGHAAMISKFMSPTKNSVSEVRSQELKNMFNIDSTSSIFCRNARNNVEHLDERIDDWILAGTDRIIEMVFDNRKGYEFLCGSKGEPRRWFVRRAYLIEEDSFLSEGRNDVEEVSIATLTVELAHIRSVAQQIINGDMTVIKIGPWDPTSI